MAMRVSKASTANITTEIQAEGEFDLTLVLVMENAANGGISMKFEAGATHKWYNNRMETEKALDNLDTISHALGLKTWDDGNAVKSFTAAIGTTCRVQIVSNRKNGITYYNVGKMTRIEKVEAKPAAKGQRQAKPATDDDIPF